MYINFENLQAKDVNVWNVLANSRNLEWYQSVTHINDVYVLNQPRFDLQSFHHVKDVGYDYTTNTGSRYMKPDLPHVNWKPLIISVP